jgi:hypothetical protein
MFERINDTFTKMGKDNNNPKPAKSNQSGRKAFSNSQSQPKTDCILCFKDHKPNDESTNAKFTESDGAEVSEQIRGRKAGDNEANLVALMNQLVSLGDMYKMWEDKKSKKFCQTMSRALKGQVQDDWQELVNDQDDWDEDEQKKKFIRMLQNLGSRTFGPKVFKQ